MADTRLGGEVDHLDETVLGEQPRHAVAVAQIEPAEPERLVMRELCEACLLELGVVIAIEVVDSNDVAIVRHQQSRHMEANKSGGAGNQNRRSRHVYNP